MTSDTPPFERAPDGIRVNLRRQERDVLTRLIPQLREVVEREDPSSDPAVGRLFPAAYPDDPLQNLEFEETVGRELAKERLDAIRTMESTLEATSLSEESILAWLTTLNGLRLVLGTRLKVEEETTEDDFEDEQDQERYGLYRYLTWLEGSIVEVLPVG